jgi:hypothetical protein
MVSFYVLSKSRSTSFLIHYPLIVPEFDSLKELRKKNRIWNRHIESPIRWPTSASSKEGNPYIRGYGVIKKTNTSYINLRTQTLFISALQIRLPSSAILQTTRSNCKTPDKNQLVQLHHGLSLLKGRREGGGKRTSCQQDGHQYWIYFPSIPEKYLFQVSFTRISLLHVW